ncbi:MAG TPA: glycosyl hydrolase family 18 protein [Anaerovoracaceae bacterium]|nr:glycosyl hydrolase family 18 protein [Anaerovoracaceae bacterium]
MKKRIISGLIIFCLIITGINGGLLLYLPAFGADDDSYLLFYNNKMINQKGYYINSTPYLPISMIGNYAKNPGITVDQTNKRLIINMSAQNIMMADDATTNFVKTYAGNVYIPLREIEKELYFPLNTTDQFFKLSYTVTYDTIKMRVYSGTDKIAKINQSNVQAVSSLLDGKGETVNLNLNDNVFISGETDNYHKISADDGSTVYVMKDFVTISEIDLSKIDFYAPKQSKFKRGSEKISLAWDYVSTITPSAPAIKFNGLDILSPTWFDLITDGDGSVENNGDKGYTDSAHSKGYMVWATITNSMSTKGSTAFTTKTFNNSGLLNKSVAQYIFYSCLYDVDGINIDYEDVADGDAAGLVAFTALMRNYTEKQGLVLSIDTLIPRPWTIEYDRASLAKYVDYLAVMTYDEHYSGSPAAGSIASLPWALDALEATLDEVPASKLLLGIPLYTRIWTVDSTGKIISNPSAKMPSVRNTIESKNLTPVWLNKEKQYYVEYDNGSNTSKIWLEDSRSIANRLDLVSRYNLAGAASWQLCQGEDQIWDVFYGMLKKNKSKSNHENPY